MSRVVSKASACSCGHFPAVGRGPHGDRAAGLSGRRDELHPGPVLKTSSCGKFRGNFEDARGTGHVAFVMLEHASVVEM